MPRHFAARLEPGPSVVYTWDEVETALFCGRGCVRRAGPFSRAPPRHRVEGRCGNGATLPTRPRAGRPPRRGAALRWRRGAAPGVRPGDRLRPVAPDAPARLG